MRAPRALLTGSAAMFAANLSRAVSQFLLIVVLAQLGRLEDVAYYTLAVAVTTPLFTVAEMSLRNVYLTLQHRASTNTYYGIRAVAAITALAASMVLFLFDPRLAAIGALVAAVRAIDSVSDMALAPLQQSKRYAIIAALTGANAWITLLVAAALLFATRSLPVALAASLVVSAVVCVLSYLAARTRGLGPSGRSNSARSVRGILRAGLPSGLAFASVSVLAYLPVYLLSAHGSLADIARFAVLSYLISFASLALGSIQQVLIGDLADVSRSAGFGSASRAVRRLGGPVFAITLATSLLTVWLGPVGVALVFGPQYAVSVMEILPIAATLLLLPIVASNSALLLVLNVYRTQLLIALASVVAAAGMGLLLSFEGFTLVEAGLVVFAGTAVRVGLGTWVLTIRSRRTS
ncbi:lipopolysaccharide biosynthesis protein [Yonghaparkia sp. Root332]|uniref:lipopolysaccharide biosynthesis protein n=1 Tax=Yonghaparkia sp. Root332 TaxID=1736516 RepID=UPI0012E3A0B8|nr:hypothetical protein [Yonghaparkia sp. Root332]